jgi:hypothetical protein
MVAGHGGQRRDRADAFPAQGDDGQQVATLGEVTGMLPRAWDGA